MKHLRRRVPLHEQKCDPLTGRKRCLVCDTCVPKGRSSYCSDECYIRNTPAMIRSYVERRDEGVCAGCNAQCQWRGNRHGVPYEERRLMPRWEADHVVPVVEGGGLCGIDGYRTLCTACHKKASAALAARLAASRKAMKIQADGDKSLFGGAA